MLAEAVATLRNGATNSATGKPSLASASKAHAAKETASKSVSSSAAVNAETDAERLKEEGNAAFKAGRYDDAARRYSEAIQRNPDNAVYYSNRAMANLKLGLYSFAEGDCDTALEIESQMVKALLRRGSARLAQGKIVQAKEDFDRVLSIEPRNAQARQEIERFGTYGF